MRFYETTTSSRHKEALWKSLSPELPLKETRCVNFLSLFLRFQESGEVLLSTRSTEQCAGNLPIVRTNALCLRSTRKIRGTCLPFHKTQNCRSTSKRYPQLTKCLSSA